MGLRLLILGLRFGVILMYFYGPGAGPWTRFSAFPEKSGKRYKKEAKKAFSMIFRVFPENAKVRFDCAGASGLRFRPLIFWLRASIFVVRFLHSLFVFFGPSWGPRSTGSN